MKISKYRIARFKRVEYFERPLITITSELVVIFTFILGLYTVPETIVSFKDNQKLQKIATKNSMYFQNLAYLEKQKEQLKKELNELENKADNKLAKTLLTDLRNRTVPHRMTSEDVGIDASYATGVSGKADNKLAKSLLTDLRDRVISSPKSSENSEYYTSIYGEELEKQINQISKKAALEVARIIELEIELKENNQKIFAIQNKVEASLQELNE